jgi:uncharacterized protein
MRNPKRLVTAVALAALTAVLVAGTAGAQTGSPTDNGTDGADQPRTITVYGSGQIRGIPDVMDLTIGVDTRAHTAAEALKHNSELAHKVIDVLRVAGVDEKDLQTSNLSVSPITNDDGSAVIAYSVSNMVEARIKDLDKVGDVVDAATGVAGDEIVVNGLYFSFDDNTQLVAQARADAVKRARTQAEQLATAAGVELGPLQSIMENNAPTGPPVTAAPKASDGAAESATPPVEPGAQSLSVDVTLVYAIR